MSLGWLCSDSLQEYDFFSLIFALVSIRCFIEEWLQRYLSQLAVGVLTFILCVAGKPTEGCLVKRKTHSDGRAGDTESWSRFQCAMISGPPRVSRETC